MEDLSNLDIISDIFPTYPRSELAARLLCAKSVDHVIDELFAEQQAPPSKYNVGVYQLKDMFPFEPLDSLAARLQLCHGDIEQCIDGLMRTDLCFKLSDLTGLSVDQLKMKIHAVERKLSLKSTTRSLLETQNRVLLQALAEVIIEGLGLPWNGNEAVNRKVSQEEEELKLFVYAEKLLQQLNYTFLRCALRFFNYDTVKVLEIARLYTEAGLIEMTFLVDQDLAGKKALVPSFVKVETNKYLLQMESPAISYKSDVLRDDMLIPPAHGANKSAFHTLLDLHGYSVAQALPIAEATANAWWQEEQNRRVIDGRLDKFGHRANFVEDLEIITGRGLHSVGGPKIRAQVIQRLTKQGYILEEEVGRIIVQGNRRH